MKELPHLAYLSMPVEWYIAEHYDRQAYNSNSHAGIPAFSIDDVLKRNKNREYKGTHNFCAADELDEIVTCVIFKKDDGKGRRDYYHTLYLGPDTDKPNVVHALIMERLGLTEADIQLSLICGCNHRHDEEEQVY